MSERDPLARNPHTPGTKLDAGKPRVGLVLAGFARALDAISHIGTFGAVKYTDNGWVDVPDGVSRYTDAMLRHFLREGAGETHDPDSGLLHAAHLAWNALARLDLMIRNHPHGDSNDRNPNPRNLHDDRRPRVRQPRRSTAAPGRARSAPARRGIRRSPAAGQRPRKNARA